MIHILRWELRRHKVSLKLDFSQSSSLTQFFLSSCFIISWKSSICYLLFPNCYISVICGTKYWDRICDMSRSLCRWVPVIWWRGIRQKWPPASRFLDPLASCWFQRFHSLHLLLLPLRLPLLQWCVVNGEHGKRLHFGSIFTLFCKLFYGLQSKKRWACCFYALNCTFIVEFNTGILEKYQYRNV